MATLLFSQIPVVLEKVPRDHFWMRLNPVRTRRPTLQRTELVISRPGMARDDCPPDMGRGTALSQHGGNRPLVWVIVNTVGFAETRANQCVSRNDLFSEIRAHTVAMFFG